MDIVQKSAARLYCTGISHKIVSYRSQPQDCIVQESATRLYRTRVSHKIVSYKGFRVGKRGEGKEAVQHICIECEVQLKRGITPLLSSTSALRSLILIHEDPHLGLVAHLDALQDPCSGHAPGAFP